MEKFNENLDIGSSEKNTPSDVQKSASLMLFYFDSLTILDKQAKQYAKTKITRREFSSKNALYTKVKSELVDIFFTTEFPDITKEETEVVEGGEESLDEVRFLYQQCRQSIQERRDHHLYKSSSLSKVDIIRITLKAGRRISSLTPLEQSYLLQHIGYNKDEIDSTLKSIATAGVLSGAVMTGGYFVSAAVTAKEAIEPLLSNITDYRTQLLLGTSYIIRYLALGFTAHQNLRLLNQFKTNSNIISTTVYLLLKKLYPENNQIQSLGVYISSILPPAMQDVLTAGILLTPVGPSIIALKNVATTGINSLVLGGENLF